MLSGLVRFALKITFFFFGNGIISKPIEAKRDAP